MLVKIINSYRYIVAICDFELIGKYFEENEFQLNIKENFYNGEKKSEKELLKIIQDMSKEDATFNIIGERSTNTAIKAGIISKDSVRTIQGVPFSLVLI
jgi:hypothetical protein